MKKLIFLASMKGKTKKELVKEIMEQLIEKGILTKEEKEKYEIDKKML